MSHRSAYNAAVTITAWIEFAIADAEARGLPALRDLLSGLARSTAVLRAADWNDDASAPRDPRPAPDAR
jgi:hypothetical protein